jgi:hypothetical protein
MPNHITQHIHFKCSGGELQKIRVRLAGVKGDNPFCFERIVPCPAEVRRYPDPLSLSNECHDWRSQNWGTKWNSYAHKELPDGWEYQTAWARPDRVLRALSALFPAVPFTVEAVDEGGWPATTSDWLGGKLLHEHRHEWTTDEARALRAHLREWDNDNTEAGNG